MKEWLRESKWERESKGERSEQAKAESDGESDKGKEERRWRERDGQTENETDGERETWYKWQSPNCQSPSAFRRPQGREDACPSETSTNNKTASLTIFRNLPFVWGRVERLRMNTVDRSQ